MSGIFQGYTNSNGRVRASEVTEVPAGSANDRGMIVAGNRVIPYQIDAGQPRTFHDGIAFDNVTGMLLAATTPFGQTNISMGGLLVDSRGAVMLTDGAAQVIHQGVGLQNNGRLSIESEPIATFIAHLSNNVASTTGPGTFTRASDGLYLGADGNWRIAPANEPRFENGKLLMEPAITNKCTNYNAKPDAALTNVELSGDPAGVISRVDDPALLEAAGLGEIGNGFVVEMDNSAGSVIALALFGGITGNTNEHSGSFWARKISGVVDPEIRTQSGSGAVSFSNTSSYQKIVTNGFTPAGAGNRLGLYCPAGTVARCVLNQLEESPVVTSPIITQGAAGQRAIDVLQYGNGASILNDAQGMSVVEFSPGFSNADVPFNTVHPLLYFAVAVTNFLYLEVLSSGLFQVASYDGAVAQRIANINIAAGSKYLFASRWASGGRQLGFYDGATWLWSISGAYSGSFPNDGTLRVSRALTLPMQMSNIHFYDEDRGTAWIEENYP